MRNGKRFDENVADFKTRAGGEDAAVKFGFELILGSFVGRAVAVNGNAEFFPERGQTLDMVAVFVRDENAGEIFRRATDGGEALADLAEIDRRTLGALEAGRTRPQLRTALALSSALGYDDVRVLFGESGLTFAEQNARTQELTGPERLAAFGALPQSKQDEVTRNIAASAEAARQVEGEG